MSKTVKGMMIREYRARLDGVEDAAVISIRGVSSNATNEIRSGLRKKNIRVQIVRNQLANKVFEGSGLAALGPIMKGPSALAFGGQSVVEVTRELIELLKLHPTIELKGAVIDGELFVGEKGVKELSKLPTRDEAIAQAVALILGPAKKLMAQVKGPGAGLAGVIKAIEEKLEKGETIAKAS